MFALGAAIFGVSAVVGFAIAQRLPFNALAVISDQPQAPLSAVVLSPARPSPSLCRYLRLVFALLRCLSQAVSNGFTAMTCGAPDRALAVVAVLLWLFPAAAPWVDRRLGLLVLAALAGAGTSRQAIWREALRVSSAQALVYAAISTYSTTHALL